MDGYPKLAALIGASPEIAIFRRFGNLNVQNLLYLQAELTELEGEYNDTAFEDFNSADAERQSFSKQWWALSQATGGNRLQWEKMLVIRSKLEQYSPPCRNPQSSPRSLQLAQIMLFCKFPRSVHSVPRQIMIWISYGPGSCDQNLVIDSCEAENPPCGSLRTMRISSL